MGTVLAYIAHLIRWRNTHDGRVSWARTCACCASMRPSGSWRNCTISKEDSRRSVAQERSRPSGRLRAEELDRVDALPGGWRSSDRQQRTEREPARHGGGAQLCTGDDYVQSHVAVRSLIDWVERWTAHNPYKLCRKRSSPSGLVPNLLCREQAARASAPLPSSSGRLRHRCEL